MVHRILISAGGTGGHLFPAQALATELKNQNIEFLFVGANLENNPFFDCEKFPFREIEAGSISAGLKFKNFSNALKIYRGWQQSKKVINDFDPDLIVAFGSFHTFPLLLAAQSLKRRFYLHEQNKVMGRVNRFFAKRAKKIIVSFEKTQPNFKHSLYAKMPLKFSKDENFDIKKMRSQLNLDPLKKTLMVCGGSQGARSINRMFLKSIPLLKAFDFQVIHVVGFNENIQDIKKDYQERGIKAYVTAFESKIEHLMAACDFIISRAGASCIAELLELKIPSLLIPYPYARAHQEFNADFFEVEVRGGVKLSESHLNESLLAKAVASFFNSDNLSLYRQNIENYYDQCQWASFSETLMTDLQYGWKK